MSADARSTRGKISHATLRAARAIAAERALAEVAGALHERGIRPLLIKGPAVARWLYDDPGERTYGDIDLLVDPRHFDAAELTLARIGFHDTGAGMRVCERAAHEREWLRAGDPKLYIDLHRTILLVPAPPARTWASLSEHALQHSVAGTRIDTPRPAAHLLILALHAAHHGSDTPKPLTDLRRAILRVDRADWVEAAELGAGLGAAGVIRLGLQLVDGGRELADDLALADDAPRAARLGLSRERGTSLGVQRLVATRGLRPRVALIAHKLAPSRAFMRRWRPLAASGPIGLALIYAWRPLWLAGKLPGGALSWGAVAFGSESRGRQSARLAGGWWALRALRSCRTQLRRGELEAVSFAAPPADRTGTGDGIARVLHRCDASCLERSLIRQRWHAANGRPRDVVIGVRGPAIGFAAHAWLDGDPPDPGGFEELRRVPLAAAA